MLYKHTAGEATFKFFGISVCDIKSNTHRDYDR
ncbi:hypothetical protein ALP48_200021 [Pseudomonas syringae pv. solidagae]|uniref:Uncharacterized protein n=1 Tax=Pseudomonas syringae pv. solidagae TaxID=264458 RepID=A0A3M5KT33_PSESX|nr:hypothetical protein ALP48_200021 [Pseudomonas syringae pv. solidagae]